MKTLKIGIIGLGTVGTSVVNVLLDNLKFIEAKTGKTIQIVAAVAKNIHKKRALRYSLDISQDIDKVLDNDEIDIIIELIGEIEIAKQIAIKALSKGKHLITANKALLAYHSFELQEFCQNSSLAYEASVAGGIPIINALKTGLSTNHIINICGIMNGTCNFILSTLASTDKDFGTILKQAQDLGYAEAEPSLDIDGFDAAHKILILATLAFGIYAKPKDIFIQGIQGIQNIDIISAKKLNCVIKHLAIAEMVCDDAVSLRVQPVLVPKDYLLAQVNGVMNAVSVYGNVVGETFYYGPGAGGDATASAILADLITLARDYDNAKRVPSFGFYKQYQSFSLVAKDGFEAAFYCRIQLTESVSNNIVFAIFKEYKIAIERFWQETQYLILVSQKTLFRNINEALAKLDTESFVLSMKQ